MRRNTVEHLDELRSRLIIALFAIVPAFALTFAFHERIMDWLTGPLPDDKKLVTLGVVEPFTVSVKVSLIAAIAITLPVILWQVWAFLAPAVDPHFERVVLVFVLLATGLFVLGVLFMYYVVLPRALDFLTSYDQNIYDIQIRASYYYSFAALTLLAGGLGFLMPIFVLALVRLRVLTTQRMRKRRSIAYVLLLVFAHPDGGSRLAPVRNGSAPPPVRGVDLARGAHGAPVEPRLGRRLRRSRHVSPHARGRPAA